MWITANWKTETTLKKKNAVMIILYCTILTCGLGFNFLCSFLGVFPQAKLKKVSDEI